jgi:hypothetical protein
MQCFYYAALGFLLLFLDILAAQPVTLNHILAYTTLRSDTAMGWMYMFTFLLTACPCGALGLRLIVTRAKLCLDFTVTCHFFHLILSWLYQGFPTTATWWLCMLCSILIMSLGGEYLCMRKEMEPITISGGGTRQRNDGPEEIQMSLLA